MTNFIDAAVQAASELYDQSHLHAYAAEAAVQELIRNWRDAIHDGAKPENLLLDIEAVIVELQSYRADLKKRMEP